MTDPNSRTPEDPGLDDALEKEIQEALGEASLLGIGQASKSSAPSALPDAPVDPDAQPEPGHFADATISGVGAEDVFVEFGPRAQGVIPSDQFSSPPDVGETVRVYVERFDGKEGLYLCGLKKALQSAAGWGSVEVGAVVNATPRAVNKGGLTVQVGHLSGFLPASHLALERIEDLESVIGETFPVEVIEVDPDKRRLVVSRRAVLARERDTKAASTLDQLQAGDILSGTVSRVEKFGAFVDLGGVDGLVHVSQMAWTRVENPEDVVKKGDVVKVQVLEIKPEDQRISLGMKQLLEDPWMTFTHRHPEGSVLKGTVTRLAPYGAFVELTKGVEGLAHVSQLASGMVGSPREVVRAGETVTVRIMNVDGERHRIGLSLLSERGDLLTDDVADDSTIREVLDRSNESIVEPTLGDLLKKALEKGGQD